MAKLTNAFDTYASNATNIMYEDLIDVVTNIDPVDSYVTSNTGNVRSKQRYHEWTTDSLLSVQTAAAGLEGGEFSAAVLTGAARTGNYCQIINRDWAISDTMEATDTVGGGQAAYQMERHVRSLTRDIEYALLVNSTSASGATGTARALMGMLGWVSTNNTTGSTASNVTEANVNTNLQLIWAAGGVPRVALMGGYQKGVVEGFDTRSREVGLTASEASIQAAVDIYKSRFGTLMLKLHHHMHNYAAGSILILGDMNLWKKAWLRPIKRMEIPRSGSARKFRIEAELTLESRQEKGSGKLTLFKSS